jgi:hypothetical protein
MRKCGCYEVKNREKLIKEKRLGKKVDSLIKLHENC